MTNGRMQNRNAKRRPYVRDLGDGLELRAEVSPCVFMYATYPLQLTVTLQRRPREYLGIAYAVDRTKTAATYSDADVKRLLAGIRTGPCSQCSTPAFDPATVKTNRNGLCEACFLSKLESEFAASEEAEQQTIAASDRRMKQEGMAVRVSGWVHPQGGGDDYQVDWYLDAHPAPAQIRKLFLQEGSSLLHDYEIIVL